MGLKTYYELSHSPLKVMFLGVSVGVQAHSGLSIFTATATAIKSRLTNGSHISIYSVQNPVFNPHAML